jgi:hypothetical protein
MSVVTHEANDYFAAKTRQRCAECEGPLHYPFLYWNNHLALCARCCVDMKNGLFADFVHVIAIKELHDLGYKQETLTRERTALAMEREKKMQAPEPELINFPVNK